MISFQFFVDFMFHKSANEVGNGRIESADKLGEKTNGS